MRTACACLLAMVAPLAGCYQIHHPTHVRPGVRIEAATGIAYVTPRPDRGASEEPATGFDLLFGFGYGKRFGRSAVLVHGTLPITAYFHDGAPGQKFLLPAFSFFAQSDTADDKVSYGAGVIVGLRPAAYAQIGLGAPPTSRNGISVDLGVRYDRANAVAPYGLVTARRGRLDIGAWVDHTMYLVAPPITDDPTDADYSLSRFSAGLLIRGAFGDHAIAATPPP